MMCPNFTKLVKDACTVIGGQENLASHFKAMNLKGTQATISDWANGKTLDLPARVMLELCKITKTDPRSFLN